MGYRPRIWVPSVIRHGASIDISKASHYLFNVMRYHVGDSINIFNSYEGEWVAVVNLLKKKECFVVPSELVRAPIKQRLDTISSTKEGINQAYFADQFSNSLALAFSPFKAFNPSFIVQKATELGVDEIIPIISEYTIVRHIKKDKLFEVAIEATEQCERLEVPYIHELISLDHYIIDFIKPDSSIHKPRGEGMEQKEIIIVCDPRQDGYTPTSLGSALQALKLNHKKTGLKVTLLIGPEGGFSTREINLLKEKSPVYFLRIGTTILKAETACITALAVCKTILDLW